jgi:hypothetical protein
MLVPPLLSAYLTLPQLLLVWEYLLPAQLLPIECHVFQKMAVFGEKPAHFEMRLCYPQLRL